MLFTPSANLQVCGALLFCCILACVIPSRGAKGEGCAAAWCKPDSVISYRPQNGSQDSKELLQWVRRELAPHGLTHDEL